jgi:hypothetical protein
VSLNSIYICRNWESPFTYTLVPQEDSGGADGEATLYQTGDTSPYVNFDVDLSVATVNISGPYIPPPTGKNLGNSSCLCVTTPTSLPSSPGNPSLTTFLSVSGSPVPNASSGDPINAATGNVFEAETDFAAAPVTELALTRYYNSQDTIKGAFGAGWHSP